MKFEAPIVSFHEYTKWLSLYDLSDNLDIIHLLIRYYETEQKNKYHVLANLFCNWLYRNEGTWK